MLMKVTTMEVDGECLISEKSKRIFFSNALSDFLGLKENPGFVIKKWIATLRKKLLISDFI